MIREREIGKLGKTYTMKVSATEREEQRNRERVYYTK